MEPSRPDLDWGPSGDREWTVPVVVSITVLALIARFVLLGDRVAHWDEARVGFWILDFMQTGNYSYMPVIHGPFYHFVNPVVFGLFGVSDATMRIVPALVTGLLPLSVLLFRDRLHRLELVALALFLAIDPIHLYYSRFMRGDPLVGAFMFAGFAFLVRAIDTGRTRHVLGAAGTIALGFTAKENAVVYVLCWLGALGVLLDQRLLVARYRDPGQWLPIIADTSKRIGSTISRYRSALFLGVVEFFFIIIFFYVPRENGNIHVSGPNGGTNVGLNVIANPLLLIDVVREGVIGPFQKFYTFWGDGGRSEHAYLPYLVDLLETIGYGAATLCLLALIGFLVSRYAADRSRPLVTFTFAWGLASLLGYPIITDIKAPWAAVHIVLPLMIPAAVGVATVVRRGRTAIATRQWASAGVLTLILLLASAQIVGIGIHSVYLEPQSPDNELIQYAQPKDDMHPMLHEMERIITQNQDGTDVLIYGPPFVQGDPIYNKPSCTGKDGWHDTLPLPWYLMRSDATVTCAESETGLGAINGSPSIVIAKAEQVTKNESSQTVTVPTVPDELETRFAGYNVTIRQMRTTDTDVVFLFDNTSDQRIEKEREQTSRAPTPPDNRTTYNITH